MTSIGITASIDILYLFLKPVSTSEGVILLKKGVFMDVWFHLYTFFLRQSRSLEKGEGVIQANTKSRD